LETLTVRRRQPHPSRDEYILDPTNGAPSWGEKPRRQLAQDWEASDWKRRIDINAGFELSPESADKLRALAVVTAMRSPALPDISTVSEYLPGFEASTLDGVEDADRDHPIA
jgi:hypothetical protein